LVCLARWAIGRERESCQAQGVGYRVSQGELP
jgi:hypothetical protein